MKLIFRFLIITLFFIGLQNVVFAQAKKNNTKDYFKWYDNLFPEGSLALYNGFKYLDTYRTENGNNQFLFSGNNNLGSVYYNNQKFFDVYINYDIFKDELIVQLPYNTQIFKIRLVKKHVKYFQIKNNVFINLPKPSEVESDYMVNGFYQIIHEASNLSVYKKHYKIEQKYIEDYISYTKFNKKDYYVVKFKGNYKRINSVKDFRKFFPKYKKQILSFYKKERKVYKKNPDSFYKKLLVDINHYLTKTPL